MRFLEFMTTLCLVAASTGCHHTMNRGQQYGTLSAPPAYATAPQYAAAAPPVVIQNTIPLPQAVAAAPAPQVIAQPAPIVAAQPRTVLVQPATYYTQGAECCPCPCP